MARQPSNNDEDLLDEPGSTHLPVDRRKFLTATGALAAGISPTIASASQTPIRNDATESTQRVCSPNGKVKATFALENGSPQYSVSYSGRTVIEPSSLGYEFRDADSLGNDLHVTGVETHGKNTTWQPVWGETEEVRNHYNELAVGLAETGAGGRSLTLLFRAYNDGIGFRYVLPAQENLGEFTITDEKTEFEFADDYTCWWIPDNYDSYEDLYNETPLSEIKPSPDVGAKEDGVNTPLTMKVDDDLYMSLHEADLTDYAGMTVTRIGDQPAAFESTLVPLPDGAKVKAESPHASPWRTLTLGEEPGDLVESKLVLNLNDPSNLEDTDWIEPGKYMGVWWELHIGKSTWAPGPDVGATTENAKKYIDFASEHGIEGVLVEGWNVGWENGFDQWSNPSYTFDFTESIGQYDLEEVVAYGQNKEPPVDVVIHNETGGGVANYVNQLEGAYSYYEELGIPAAKLGYVSADGLQFEDGIYYHHSQRAVNHYEYVTRKAAEHGIMLDIHEPIKPTGKRRTWPNLMTQEGFRGLEYENASPRGNPPQHTLVLPFTRMLGGPVDYTPGIFDITHAGYGGDTRVHNTRARQLALYPILFSGLQMAADLPTNYDDLDEFEFIENVPAAWDQTEVVHGEIGGYVTFARRKDEEWYVGSGTDENQRVLDVPLDFLGEGERPYIATVYTDGEDANLYTNPEPIEIDEFVVTASDAITASMVAGGGQAIHLRPAEAEDLTDLSRYERPEYEYDTFVVQEEVMASEPITAMIEVTNTGSVIGGEWLTLYVDGEPAEHQFARIRADNEEQIDFSLQLRETGTHEVALGRSPDDIITSRTIEVAPKSTEFEWLSFEGFEVPQRVAQGGTVEVSGTVTNTGSDETLQVLKMAVDADVVQAKEIDLEPGKNTEVTFNHTFNVPGEYSVTIEDLGPWTVTVPEPGETGS